MYVFRKYSPGINLSTILQILTIPLTDKTIFNMKKSILSFCLLVIFSSQFQLVHAQSNHEACGTELTPEVKQYLDDTREYRQRFKYDLINSRMAFQIPVQFHIFHKDSGVSAGDITDGDIQTIINELNAAYAPINMVFVECAPPFHHDDTQFYNFSPVEENAMLDKYEVSGVLNLYYPKNVTGSSGISICGYASFPNTSRRVDLVVVDQGCADNETTTIHEVGHYFSLLHTHQGGLEFVNGTNCLAEGDEICDTPADPNLSGKVDKNTCTYTGTELDPNGQAYNPPINNHMSYSAKPCRTVLTTAQLDRVAFSALNDRDYLDCNGCEDYAYEGSFNYGEDFTSHDYTTTGNVFTTNSQDCYSGNPQLRVGNCSVGTGSVTVTFDVIRGTDKLKLDFKTRWSVGAGADVYIDGVKRGRLTGNSSCASQILHVDNIAYLTLDGKVEIKVEDPQLGCSGDINLDRLKVHSDRCAVRNYYAALPYQTGFESGQPDNYWRMNKSSKKGRIQVTGDFFPQFGNKHLTMDVDPSIPNAPNFSTNEAWLHLDMTGCSNVDLSFYWKEFRDEPHNEDGVFFSDDGGNTFVKVLNLTGGAFNFWNPETLDVDALATTNGLSLSSTFVIKFQQRDNMNMMRDGIAIDHVLVYGCSTYDLDENAQSRFDDLVQQFHNMKNKQHALTTMQSEFEGHFMVFPNPAHNFTQFEFTVVEDKSPTSLIIYDLNGRQVAHVLEGSKLAGTHSEELDLSHLTTGIYLAVLRCNGTVQTQKLVVSK